VVNQLASIGIGTFYLQYYALYLAALALSLLVIRVPGRRWPRGLRVTAGAIVGLLFLRLVLFDNPVAFRFYRHYVSPETVGLRQLAVLELEIAKYRRDLNQPRLANLAVGSSQVGAIFSHWVSDPPQPLRVYSMAGMKALDYVLYEEAIAAYNPARVILYLSAFDLTAAPELYSLPLAPSRPSAMWSVISRLRNSGVSSAETDGPIHEFVASQLFPEYRYSFVFKAFLKPWFRESGERRVASAPVLSDRRPRIIRALFQGSTPDPTVDEATRQHIREFVGYYYPEWLDYNYAFLKDFVVFCQTRGIEVVIAEGQVNPIVKSAKVDALNAMVRSRFAELEAQFSNVMFVPASEVYTFAAADYIDLTHVDRPAAMKYTQRLSSYLAPAPAPEMTGACGLTFLSGWYGREVVGTGWLRWSDGTGQLRATARDSVDLVLEGELISLVRPNTVDLAVNGRQFSSIRIDDPAWAFRPFQPVRLHVDAGQSVVIAFIGHARPAQQPTDPRPLAIALKDLRLRLADGTVTCELTADAATPRRVKPF
jgi:hypothetical protein